MAKKAVKKEAVSAQTRSAERRAVTTPAQSAEGRTVAAPAQSTERRAVSAPVQSAERHAVSAPAQSTERRSETKVEVYLQFGDKEVKVDEIMKAAQEDFRSSEKKAVLESVQLYLKPEDCAAYYVANGAHSGKIAM